MMDRDVEEDRSSVLAIEGAAQAGAAAQTRGSAVVLGPHHLLTCAHVVLMHAVQGGRHQQANNAEPVWRELRVRGGGLLNVVFVDGTNDLALLYSQEDLGAPVASWMNDPSLESWLRKSGRLSAKGFCATTGRVGRTRGLSLLTHSEGDVQVHGGIAEGYSGGLLGTTLSGDRDLGVGLLQLGGRRSATSRALLVSTLQSFLDRSRVGLKLDRVEWRPEHDAIIDFGDERSRHKQRFGRDDLLARLRGLLQFEGWVILKGAWGTGKSAVMHYLLQELEQVAPVPHHFIRRGQEGDEPDAVATNLCRQLLWLFPEVEPTPAEIGLLRLLQMISRQVLIPQHRHLTLFVDGLDEISSLSQGNPLSKCLPRPLPPRVTFVVASRPADPHLTLFADQPRVELDLDADPSLRASSAEACRLYLTDLGASPKVVRSLTQSVEGKFLICKKMHAALGSDANTWTVEQLSNTTSRELRDLYDLWWSQRIGDKDDCKKVERIKMGLGFLCAAREGLPRRVLTSLCGDDWSSDEFRKTMLPLLASTSKGEDETFRIDHDSLREFFIGLLDAPEATARKLADALCRWPASSSEFARRYALRHGLRHWRELGEWDRFATLALDARYLDAFCSEVGMVALNAELDATFAAVGDRAPRQLCTLRQFVNARVDDCDLWESLDRPMGQDFYAWCVLEGICAAGTLNHFTPPRILMRGGAVRPSARLVLRGHSDAIAACALVGDGRRALSASKDGTLRVWNVERGEVVRVLKGHSSPVTACALVGDGRRALSLSEEGTILGWDLENGASILRLDTGLEYSYVCFSGDGKRVVLGSGLGTLRLWDLEKGKCSHLLETGLPASRPFAISRDGKRVLWSSIHAKVWDVETGLSNAVVEEGSTLVATYEVLGGDQRALLRNEGKLQVWDLENGETIGSLNSFHQSAKWAINGDGKLAVSAGDDGWVVVWDLEKGERCSWRHYCWERVLMCTVAGGGGIAMIADEEGSIGVWDLETHRNILKVREPGLTACAMTRSGTRLLTGSVDGTLRVWDLKTASTHRFHGHPEPVRACAATGNGNRALTLSEDGTLRVWDLEERKCVDWLDGQPQNVTALAASAGGRRALLGSNDGTLRVWDLDERKCVHLLIGDSHDINACAISGDELRALSVSWDGTLRVWDLEKGICIHTLKGGGRDTWHCAMSKDGRRAMTGSKVGTLRVWDLEQGKRLHTLKCGSRSITACAMIGEGRQAWSASQDGTIRVWDLERGERLHTLRGHTRSVWMCAMTGDAGQALSASDDGLRVWDLKNGECIRTLAVDAVWGAATCAVNGDGRHAVSASGPDMLQWWDLASGTLLHSFKGTAPFLQLSTCDNGTIIAGDLDGNVWILEVDSGLWPRTPA